MPSEIKAHSISGFEDVPKFANEKWNVGFEIEFNGKYKYGRY